MGEGFFTVHLRKPLTDNKADDGHAHVKVVSYTAETLSVSELPGFVSLNGLMWRMEVASGELTYSEEDYLQDDSEVPYKDTWTHIPVSNVASIHEFRPKECD